MHSSPGPSLEDISIWQKTGHFYFALTRRGACGLSLISCGGTLIVELSEVTVLELTMVPDKSGGAARASLVNLRLG